MVVEVLAVMAAAAERGRPTGAAAEGAGKTANATLAAVAVARVAGMEVQRQRKGMGARETRKVMETKGHRPLRMPRGPLPSRLMHCSSHRQAPLL